MRRLFFKILLFYLLLFILIKIPVFANEVSKKFIVKVNNKIIDVNNYIVYKDGRFVAKNTSTKAISNNKFLINFDGINFYIELINDKEPFAILSVSNAICEIKHNQLIINKSSLNKTDYFYLNISLKNKIIIINSKKIILDNSQYMKIVNKNNPLASNFIPKDLVYLKGKINAEVTNSMRLKRNAAMQLGSMIKEANRNGVRDFVIRSAYRSYNDQTNIYTSYLNRFKKIYPNDYRIITAKYVQKPGMSEHQTGLAIDISSKSRNNYSSFEQTNHYKWLKQNSWKYGFIIRYPKDKTKITGISFEPWHLRYVGEPFAELLYRNNWALEEFTNHISKEKFIVFKSYQGIYYLITDNKYKLLK
ncbi:D-alanyl-D-alanine carboxypeptidase [Caloramator mitchellensis]|uniref:D-alanyl-D-alanine carboxypeptidase n=1 Tax=Caloramator mitchellensis TaxID=908809 RepID=A0A0R3K0F0_CALMK|nr:M15 family metallopeptidase [Caloramator mitchellensis]KRQ86389.1 D-alanyl-D-alanine carboxypeptidase [Caloramator mitchellensis]